MDYGALCSLILAVLNNVAEDAIFARRTLKWELSGALISGLAAITVFFLLILALEQERALQGYLASFGKLRLLLGISAYVFGTRIVGVLSDHWAWRLSTRSTSK
jgi:hypothetical protein